MNLKEIYALRDKTPAGFYEHYLDEDDPRIRATAAEIPGSTDRRIAIGAQFAGKRCYRLTVRVQRDSGPAMRVARELEQESDAEDLDLGIAEKISVPAQTELRRQASASADGGHHPGSEHFFPSRGRERRTRPREGALSRVLSSAKEA